LGAAFAEVTKGGGRDRVADLHLQVREHGSWRIPNAGLHLLDSPAAPVDDPARQGGRAAAAEPLEHHDLAATPSRLKPPAGASGTEADHDDVGLEIPCLRH